MLRPDPLAIFDIKTCGALMPHERLRIEVVSR